MTQDEINDFAAKLYAHIGHNDYVIAAIGVRGPNIDMPAGNVLATVRMGSDEATAEAKYLGVYPLGTSSLICYSPPHHNSTPHSEADGAGIALWEKTANISLFREGSPPCFLFLPQGQNWRSQT